MKSQDLLDKLDNLNRDEYDETSQATFDAWKKRIEDLEAIRAIAKTDVIQGLVKKYREAIKQTEVLLLTKRKMPELERENLLDQKDLFQDFINTFDVDKSLDNLANEIEKHL